MVWLQTFTVAEPVWLKYLQFHFISHHGSEPICALNDVLVFGKSAAEDLEDQLSDEALLTAEGRPGQPGTALDSHMAADRHQRPVEPGQLDKVAAAGGYKPESAPEEAVKPSNTAVEASVNEITNTTSASDIVLLAKGASDANRLQNAAEHTLGGPRTGQQCKHLRPVVYACSVNHAFLRPQIAWTLVRYCLRFDKQGSFVCMSALCTLIELW